ncbi:41663_t:CDS:2, partial [Gigaspora margarita]
MSQIRSELLHSRNIRTYKQNIAVPFERINPDDDNEEFILSEDNTDNNDIDMETLRIVIIWKHSNESEILTDLYDNEYEVMHQDYIIYPADNLRAKWKLSDIFAESLAQPDSIRLLL